MCQESRMLSPDIEFSSDPVNMDKLLSDRSQIVTLNKMNSLLLPLSLPPPFHLMFQPLVSRVYVLLSSLPPLQH